MIFITPPQRLVFQPITEWTGKNDRQRENGADGRKVNGGKRRSRGGLRAV